MRRLFFFIFICVLALNCRASEDASRLPPMEEVLSLIGQRTAPLIRRCVLREVSENLSQWVARQEQQNQKWYADAESIALANNCFMNADDDPEFEASLWRHPESFIGALTAGKLLGAYDSRKIQTLVDAYNGHQKCLFGLEKSCWADESDPLRLTPVNKVDKNPSFDWWKWGPVGYTNIVLHDFEKSFVLSIGRFSGTDSYESNSLWYQRIVIFRKNDLTVASSYDGFFMKVPDRQIFLIARNMEVYSSDSTTYHDVDRIIVYDARNFRELMNDPLLKGSIFEIEIQETPLREAARFHVTFQDSQFISAPKGSTEDACPIGWAKYFEYRYSIGCRADTGKCELTKRLLRSYEDCATSPSGC